MKIAGGKRPIAALTKDEWGCNPPGLIYEWLEAYVDGDLKQCLENYHADSRYDHYELRAKRGDKRAASAEAG